jgi:hypothetical protein
MTTSWASSIDNNKHGSISSSSTDKNEHEKSIDSSSEGSIFSDSDIHQKEEESHKLPLVNFERGPSFLIPNV